MKRILFAAFALSALWATAMPTKEELANAQSIVNELMADHIAANKKGKESNEAVGDAAMALAKDADGEAAKFALFRGAVTYYARGKAYDKAADAIESIMSEVSDVPPETLNGIVQKAAATATESKAPRLVALKKAIGRREKAAASLKELKPKLKKSPNDPALKRMHAELVAATGDWEAALKEFAALGGEVGKVAEGEANGGAATAADFWWDYTPAALEAKDAIKEHAAALYRRALDYGELEGLKKNLAEKRIAEGEGQTVVAINPKRPAALSARLRTGLVGYWTFDDNAKDSTKNHNNGEARGVTPTEDRYGNAKGAYNFNGKSYVEVPNSPTLHDITSAITISAWIKPKGWCNGWIVIMQKGDMRNSQFQSAINKDNFVELCGEKGIIVRGSSLGVELNKWQHVVLTYESGKDLRFYRNGIQMCSAMVTEKLQQDNCCIYIGCDPCGAAEYFIGDMDDVRLYKRALSEKEVQELYRAESAGLDN